MLVVICGQNEERRAYIAKVFREMMLTIFPGFPIFDTLYPDSVSDKDRWKAQIVIGHMHPDQFIVNLAGKDHTIGLYIADPKYYNDPVAKQIQRTFSDDHYPIQFHGIISLDCLGNIQVLWDANTVDDLINNYPHYMLKLSVFSKILSNMTIPENPDVELLEAEVFAATVQTLTDI